MDRPLNFVISSPHFPPNYENFAIRLKANGVNVLGVGDEPYDNLSDNLKAHLTEYYYVESMEDYDQMYEAIRFFQEKYGSVDRIESHNEHWLELDARLRTDFDIFGFKTEDMERVKPKSGMKEVFRKNNIPVARGRVVKDGKDAKKLIKELGYPVIVKPDSGVGASDTWKINSVADLDQFLAEKDENVSYIMEEFIEGDIITFDGLTDKNGKVLFYSSQVHSSPILDVASDDVELTFYTARDFPEDLVEIGKKSVEAFELPERFFHHEFFRAKDTGELIALEINCRPPGGCAIDMMNYANSIDVYDQYAKIVTGQGFTAELTRPYNALYVSRRYDKNYVKSYDEIVHKYFDKIVSIYESPRILAGVMGDYAFIFNTKTTEEMSEMIQDVSQTW